MVNSPNSSSKKKKLKAEKLPVVKMEKEQPKKSIAKTPEPSAKKSRVKEIKKEMRVGDVGVQKKKKRMIPLLEAPVYKRLGDSKYKTMLDQWRGLVNDNILKSVDYEEIKREIVATILPVIRKKRLVLRNSHVAGSLVTGLAIKGSDVDIILDIGSEDGVDDDKINFKSMMYPMKFELESRGYRGVMVVKHAKVPIIKFQDSRRGLQCDISFNQFIPLATIRLMRNYQSHFPLLKDLILLVKIWARERSILDGSRFLSSHAISTLVIHFLQSRDILPSLFIPPGSKEYKSTPPLLYNGHNCIFKSITQFPKNSDPESFGELVHLFFSYYSSFDFSLHSISTRALKTDRAAEPKPKPLEIRDFFTDDSCCRGVDEHALVTLQNHIRQTLYHLTTPTKSLKDWLYFPRIGKNFK